MESVCLGIRPRCSSPIMYRSDPFASSPREMRAHLGSLFLPLQAGGPTTPRPNTTTRPARLVFIIPHVPIPPPPFPYFPLLPIPISPNPPTRPTLAARPTDRTLLTPTHRRRKGGERQKKKKSCRGDHAAMAGDPPTAAEREALVSSFLEIAAGQTPETATQFLQVRLPPRPHGPSHETQSPSSFRAIRSGPGSLTLM